MSLTKLPLRENSWWKPALLWLVGALIVFTRNPALFLYPTAALEDASQGIDVYANPAAPLFHFYVGYVEVGVELLYWAALRTLSLPVVPFVLAWVPLLLSGLVPAAVYQCGRHVFGLAGWPAVITALVVAILPLGDWKLISDTDYAIWPVAGLLYLCLCNPVPQSRAGVAGYFLWRALFVMTNPLCLPAALVWAVRAWREGAPRARFTHLVLTAVALGYAVFGIAPAARHGTEFFGWLGRFITLTVRLAVEKSLFGPLPFNGFLDHIPGALLVPVLILLAAAVASGCCWLRCRGGQAVGPVVLQTLLILAGIGVTAAICVVGRVDHGGQYVLDGWRYQYVPKLLWFTLLTASIVQGFAGVIANPARPGLTPGRAGLLGLAEILAALIWFNGRGAYAQETEAESRAVETFLSDAAARMARGETGPFRFARVDGDGDWSIVVGGGRQ